MAREITPEFAVLLTFNKLLSLTYYRLAWNARMSRIVCVQDNPWGMLVKYSYKRGTRIGVLTTYSITGLQRTSSSEPGVERWFHSSASPLSPVWCFPLLFKRSLKRSHASGFFKRQEPCFAIGQEHVFIKTNTLPSYLNYPVNIRQIQSPCGHILKHQIQRVKSLTARNVNPRNRLLRA